MTQGVGRHGHDHGEGRHGHTHGVIDPRIATTDRGIWAIRWSFVILAVTAVVVVLSSRVALLADTIHDAGDAVTPSCCGWRLSWLALLAANTDAARTAYAVGYESTSQFGREYTRLFGRPPKQDASQLRENIGEISNIMI